MALRDHSSDNKILDAAKQEFLEKGYENASLRKIAAKADITTGAVYVRYHNKDELFCEITREISEIIETNIVSLKKNFYKAGSKHSIKDLIQVSSVEMNAILDMLYEHYEICYLLFCCSAGSSMESFIEKLVTFKVNSTMEFFRTVLLTDDAIERESLMLIIELEYHAYVSVLRNRYSKEQAKKYLKTVTRYFIGGWTSILNNIIKGE